MYFDSFFFFFFQAEDGIRDLTVFFFFSSRRRHTRFDCDWIQTCALPIYHHARLGVPLQDLGVADRLRAVMPQAQFAVQLDPLLLREVPLLLLELQRDVE